MEFNAKLTVFAYRSLMERHHHHLPNEQASLIDALDQSLRSIATAPAIRKDPQAKRLQERLLAQGGEALSDGELLDLILGRRDWGRPDRASLTAQLLHRFGDFGVVLSAPEARLREVAVLWRPDVERLKLIEAAAHRLAQTRVMHRQVLNSWDALLDYCQTVMAYRDVEQFRILFLDNKNVLIGDEAQARGTVDHVPVYPREVIKRTLELNASALILVHNHPSGDPTPSESDLAMTDQIKQAADVMGIVLHDHLVIGRGQSLSFRAEGYLK